MNRRLWLTVVGAILAGPRRLLASSTLVGAARKGNEDAVRSLLADTADADEVDPKTGKTALLYAAYKGNVAIVRMLLAAGARVDAAVPRDIPAGVAYRLPILRGRTALWYAASRGHAEVLRELLRAGADPNVRDSAGTTPLQRALQTGRADIAAMLRASGARA